MNILVVEPDKVLAKTYQQALVERGHSVMVVHHAQDAVHASDKKAPDLVLLELQLSKHGGMEFIYEFRSYPEWQTTPIVLLTNVTPRSLSLNSELQKQFGITQCLYKPATSLKKIINAVEAIT